VGLFTSVIHVRDSTDEAVRTALKKIIPAWGYKVSEERALSRVPQFNSGKTPTYIVLPPQGSWATILEAHFAVEEAPWLPELAKALSAELRTYTLALMVHDDDVLYYNLCQNGRDLDGYNSNPQYFEIQRLTRESILKQKHDPRSFAPLLPEGVSLAELEELLNRGWWSAFNEDRLDENGIETSDEQAFLFEGERMTAMGNLLQLHGSNEEYPFTSWGDDERIDWREAFQLLFERA
jgi:hypothetical protein